MLSKLTVAMLVFSACGLAQPVTRTIGASSTYLTLADPLPTLTLNVAGSQDYVVGVVIERDNTTNDAEVAEVLHTDAHIRQSSAVFRRLSAVTAVPTGRIANAGSQLTLTGSTDPNITPVIFITLKAPVSLSVLGGPGSPVSTYVSTSVLVNNGVVTQQPLTGLNQLVFSALGMSTAPQGDQAPALSANGYSVTQATLQAHVIHVSALSAGSAAPGTPGGLVMRIDEQGHVVSVGGAGLALLAPGAADVIKTWTFRPFLSGFKPIPVTGFVAFVVQDGGKVASGLN